MQGRSLAQVCRSRQAETRLAGFPKEISGVERLGVVHTSTGICVYFFVAEATLGGGTRLLK